VGLVEEDPGASCVLGRFHALLRSDGRPAGVPRPPAQALS
jgi:hypothetical protein